MFEVERQSMMKLAMGLLLDSVVLEERQLALILTLHSSANKSASYFSESRMGLRNYVSKCNESADCLSSTAIILAPLLEVQGCFSSGYKGHNNVMQLAGLVCAASWVKCARWQGDGFQRSPAQA